MVLTSPAEREIVLVSVLYPTYLKSTVYVPGSVEIVYSPSRLVEAPIPVFRTIFAPINGSL